MDYYWRISMEMSGEKPKKNLADAHLGERCNGYGNRRGQIKVSFNVSSKLRTKPFKIFRMQTAGKVSSFDQARGCLSLQPGRLCYA